MKPRPGIQNESDETPSVEEPKGFASPPCLRHEIDPAYGGDSIEDESGSSIAPLPFIPQES